MQPSTPLISFCQHFPLFCVRRRTFGTKCCSSSGGDLWTFVVVLNYITSRARPHCRHLSGFFSLLDPCFKSYALLRTSLCSISLVIFIPDHGVHLHSHHAKQHFILMCTCTRCTSKSKSVGYMLANLPCSPGHRFRNWAHLSPNPLSCLACCVIPPPRCCSIPPCPDPLHIRSC